MNGNRSRSLAGLGRNGRVVLLILLGALLFWDQPLVGSSAAPGTAWQPAPVLPASLAGARAVDPAPPSPTAPAPLPEAAPQAEEAGDRPQAEGLAEEHELEASRFFLILIAILVFAKVFGEIAERFGQPAVLGELLAGLVLGGSVLGIVPTAGVGGEIIHLLAEVGVAILLFEIGLETDLKQMFRVGPSSTAVAAVGVATPFALGFAYWYLLDPAPGPRPEGISLAMAAIFVGATLTATSVGITARVLTDLKVMHRSESRIIIGAAVIDDVLGLVILAVVSSLAAGAALSLLDVAGQFLVAVGFLVVAVIVGNLVAPRLFRFIDRMSVRGILLVAAFSFALLFAALAAEAGSAMIIGAFAAGIVLSSTNQFDLIVERVEPVADIFTPIFFVSVGAAVNVGLFIPGAAAFNPSVIWVGAALILVAVVGKLASGYVVGWGAEGLNHAAIGVGMVPRGEVGLIFADIGLQNRILSQETFSAILIMVIVTTFIAPPLLKVTFKADSETTAEQDPPVRGAVEMS